MKHDVAIVGGGPAGLAAAIACVRAGFTAVVLERSRLPLDKACGEGLLPGGRSELEAMGARVRLGTAESHPFWGIRYIDQDGLSAEAPLADGGGLGIRRLALSRALYETAVASGVEVRDACGVRELLPGADRMQLRTDQEMLEARLVVAADGLHSPLRASLGLGSPRGGPRRFGVRRHVELTPWSRLVEVHFAGDVEAYVTPVGARCVAINFLFQRGGEARFERLLDRFPALRERVAGASYLSEARGAGPLFQAVRRRTAHRVVLMGDAAGYVDALTGEGLTLAFRAAAIFGEVLPQLLSAGATRQALRSYEARYGAIYRRYWAVTRTLLVFARNPWLRRQLLATMAARPTWMAQAVRYAAA